MKRVTITLDDETLREIDNKVKEEKASRSSVIQTIIKTYLEGTILDEEGMKIYAENEYLKQRLRDLENQLGWLQGEYSKLSNLLTRRMLPERSLWNRLKFWKR